MTRDTKLADEILTLASATSLDYQEHVYDLIGILLARHVFSHGQHVGAVELAHLEEMCIRDSPSTFYLFAEEFISPALNPEEYSAQ